MPYEVEKRGPKWVVVKVKKTADGEAREIMGKHDTEEKAKRQQAAIYASEKKRGK